MAGIWYIGEDATESLSGLTGGGSYLNSATVTYTVKDKGGTAVTGGTGSYSYTAASNGDYTATIDTAVTALLTDTYRYVLEVTISSGSYDGKRYLERVAMKRGDL